MNNTYFLETQYDARASFYKKAKVKIKELFNKGVLINEK